MKQIIEFGRGSIKQLKKFLGTKKKKILVVCSKNSFKGNRASSLIKKSFKNHEFYFFTDFSTDPKIEDAVRGCKYFRLKKCQILVAIGGGSVIDMAKLINAGQSSSSSEFKLIAKGQKKIKNNLRKLIAIPTTAGTGSESTHFAVVYIGGQKYSLASNFLIPSVAIVDPNLVETMPKYLAACTAFDALSQSIESFWSVNSNTKSRKLSLKAMELIIKNIEKSVIQKNKRSTSKLMYGSNLAGQAINITKTTAPHALSYKISSLLNLAHGHAVAITLGKFFKINQYSQNINNGISIENHLSRMEKIYDTFEVSGPEQMEMEWYKLMKKCKLESDLKKFKPKGPKIIKKIIESVNIERLQNHPVIISKNDFNRIFYNNLNLKKLN